MKQVAKKTVVNGIKFDSKDEAEFYEMLLLREKSGEIESFRCHPKFTLQPKFTKNGVTYQAITYSADFEIKYPNGRIEIIDVKGYETEKFQLKRKMFEYVFPELTLTLMKKVIKYGGWITDEQYKEFKKGEQKATRKLKSQTKPARHGRGRFIKKPAH